MTAADWTTARVVRDADGFRWRVLAALATEGDIRRFGPPPVLDADGLPVVRTVGDLTARHVGREVSVEGHAGVLSEVIARDGMVQLAVDDEDGPAWFPAVTLDTPCEVLP